MKKKWLILSAVIVVCLGGLLGVRHLVEILNEDKLVVLNSNLGEVSERDLEGRISLTPIPRILATTEVDRIADLLHPDNRHLVKDAQGRYFQFELRLNERKGTKQLVATAPAEPQRRE